MEKTNREIINTIKKEILNHKDGLTIDFLGTLQDKKEGFYIGITNNTLNLSQIESNIKTLINTKNKLFKDLNNLFIGAWIEEKTNTLFLDLSLFVENKEVAINTAKLFNQKAVFDIQNLNSIYV